MASPFPKEAALAFVDIYSKPPQPNPIYKVIAYLPKYDPDLNSSVFTTSGGIIPFREVWSSTVNPPVRVEKNGLTPFRGHLRHVSSYGKNPKTLQNNESIPRNPFESKAPEGLHIQFAIVHYWTQKTPTGSLVGVASIYDEKTQHDPQEATILNIYRVKEVPVFVDRLDIECRVAYVATSGPPPTQQPQPKPGVLPSTAN